MAHKSQRRREPDLLNVTDDALNMDGNSIEVLWKLDDGRRGWWPARIISSITTAQDIMEDEAIMYDKKYNHPATKSAVIFMKGNKLGEKDSDTTTEGSVMSWRTRRKETRERDESLRRQQSGMRPHQSCKKRGFGRIQTITDLAGEVGVLRASKETALKRINLLSRRVQLASYVNNTESTAVAEGVKRLQVFLLQRVVQQIQKPLRKVRDASVDTETRRHIMEVMASHARVLELASIVIWVYLEPLQGFAKKMRKAKQRDPLCYIPPFEMTQGPPQGAKEFHILFPSLRALRMQLSVTSVSDRLEMLYKYGSTKRGGLMRILGSYRFDPREDGKEASLYIAHSSGHHCNDSQREYNLKEVPVLTRETRSWNVEDRRFIHSLKLDNRSMVPVPMSTSEEKKDLSFHYFHMRWKRDKDARPRMWTKPVVHPAIVPGRLEVALPAVVMEGDALCDEFSKLLDPTLTISLLT